jgi:hypothetical protein
MTEEKFNEGRHYLTQFGTKEEHVGNGKVDSKFRFSVEIW